MNRVRSDKDVIRLSHIVLSLVNIYGPIDIDNLTDKIRYYFPKDSKGLSKRYIEGIVEALEEADRLIISDDDLFSFYTDEELLELEQTGLLSVIRPSVPDKEFRDPEEILNYSDMFEMKGDRRFDALKEYFDSLTFKKEEEKEELFAEMIVVICKMYDDEVYLNLLQKRIRGYLNKKKLSDLMTDFGGEIPRGFLRGYSFEEVGALGLAADINGMKLERPVDSLKYVAYSLRECIVMAQKLKQTDFFDEFCSDNLIELFIDGEEVYVQLLGYYNGDRCVIIYGNREQLAYNYQFFTQPNNEYPDLVYRLRYCEILMDDPGGFMTPEIKARLEARNYPTSPLIVQMEPLDGGPTLPDREHCNRIGTILKQLLDIYDTMGDEIADGCVEQDTQQIIQFYADKGGVSSGEYRGPDIGRTVVPFPIDPIHKEKHTAGNETELGIGNNVFSFENEAELFYFTVLYDYRKDIIIDYDLCRESEMTDVKDRIINRLEMHDLRPSSIVFNNSITSEIFRELRDFYDLDAEPEIKDDVMNEIYQDFHSHSQMNPEELLIH